MQLPFERLNQMFKNVFSDTDNIISFRAPGRVNLIGEHTDYNDGFVLPVAINREIFAVAKARKDSIVSLYSMNFHQQVEFELSSITHSDTNTWQNYPKGVLSLLHKQGMIKNGFNAVLYGDIPTGAGLSSSAAIETVIAGTAQTLFNFPMTGVKMAQLCQKAENEFVGVNCGIMDQFISRLGKKDYALLIDCRSLEYQHVPLKEESCSIVICNSGVKRGLVDSEYNTRRAQCNKAVSLLKSYLPSIHSLRDVSWEDYLKHIEKLPEVIRKRAKHVISENKRVIETVTALGDDNLVRVGELLKESHVSLRDDYEVSCQQLDLLVESAMAFKGCYGARMTGAGFGGCTINLVKPGREDEFVSHIQNEYPKQTKITPEIYICRAVDGASKC